MSNFQTKADLFNDFFVEQCSIYDNGSTLPASYIRPDQTLDFIDIDDHKILKAIRNLNPNKAHGCDDISIRMLEICHDSIVSPLRHIFTKCLEFQTFPTLWKRANILPIHKKQSRQLIKTTDRFLYYLFAGKSSKNLSSIIFTNIFAITA